MVKIAVCDDDAKELDNLYRLVKRFAQVNGEQNFAVSCFSSGEALLNAIERQGPFSIYLLDILMPGMDGISLGQRLREQDRDGNLVYLTSSAEYSLEAFHVFAFQYLLKPVEEALLFDVLSRILEKEKELWENSLEIRTHEGPVSIPFQSLVYVELRDRIVCCHLSTRQVLKSLYVRESFDKVILPLLTDRRFLRTHKSFVCNLFYVSHVEHKGFVMAGGEWVPISRKYTLEARNRYVQFLVGRRKSQQ